MTIAQNESLAKIRAEVTSLIKAGQESGELAKSLRSLLQRIPTGSVDWDNYETLFKAVHPEFARKLAETWPEISATELRVCALLKLNLRSDQIAKIFGVSERTIESHRFWIRKKMNLAKGEDLAIFLAKL
jgi:DNA-binding CsgD family transcriptional regulator